MRATINLAVCHRLSGETASVVDIEDDLVSECVKEALMDVPTFKASTAFLGIQRLLAEYRLREWHIEAIRVVKAVVDVRIRHFRATSPETMYYHSLLFGLYESAGVQIDPVEGMTVLLAAASCGNEAIVRMLLKHGIDVEAKAANGWTALHKAIWWGHEALVELLLEAGADINVVADNGATALHMVGSITVHRAMRRLVLENVIDIEAKRLRGWTALHDAACNGNEALVRLLLKKRANIQAKADDGATVLHLAAATGSQAVVRLLLKEGAKLGAKTFNGVTVLQAAAACGREEVVRLLLEEKTDDWLGIGEIGIAMLRAIIGRHVRVARLLWMQGVRWLCKRLGSLLLTCARVMAGLDGNTAVIHQKNDKELSSPDHYDAMKVDHPQPKGETRAVTPKSTQSDGIEGLVHLLMSSLVDTYTLDIGRNVN